MTSKCEQCPHPQFAQIRGRSKMQNVSDTLDESTKRSTTRPKEVLVVCWNGYGRVQPW